MNSSILKRRDGESAQGKCWLQQVNLHMLSAIMPRGNAAYKEAARNRWARRYPGGTMQRFYEKVDKEGPIVSPTIGPCWLWTGSNTGPGDDSYGTFWNGERYVLAHRFILEQIIGRELRAGFNACHHCDIGLCVRPEHLYEGTQGQNLQDAYVRRRRDGDLQNVNLLAARKAKLGW